MFPASSIWQQHHSDPQGVGSQQQLPYLPPEDAYEPIPEWQIPAVDEEPPDEDTVFNENLALARLKSKEQQQQQQETNNLISLTSAAASSSLPGPGDSGRLSRRSDDMEMSSEDEETNNGGHHHHNHHQPPPGFDPTQAPPGLGHLQSGPPPPHHRDVSLGQRLHNRPPPHMPPKGQPPPHLRGPPPQQIPLPMEESKGNGSNGGGQPEDRSVSVQERLRNLAGSALGEGEGGFGTGESQRPPLDEIPKPPPSVKNPHIPHGAPPPFMGNAGGMPRGRGFPPRGHYPSFNRGGRGGPPMGGGFRGGRPPRGRGGPAW